MIPVPYHLELLAFNLKEHRLMTKITTKIKPVFLVGRALDKDVLWNLR